MSISLGSISSVFMDMIFDLSERQLFGISMVLWFLALIINIIDIHTGIKADTKRKRDIGETFKFESNKGWRAFEKIFVFTVITAFVYFSEKEFVRLNMGTTIPFVLQCIKLIMFFYVVLIEVQSIGENEEVRFGKKGKIFKLLDGIIDIVNVGLKEKVQSVFNKNNNSNNPE